MKSSLINMRLTSRYSAESYAFAVKGFCVLFSAFKIRSGTQFHGCTELSTLCRDKSHTYLPLPQIVFLLSPRFWETRDQRFPGSLSLSRSVGRVGENPGNEVGVRGHFHILGILRGEGIWPWYLTLGMGDHAHDPAHDHAHWSYTWDLSLGLGDHASGHANTKLLKAVSLLYY